MEIIATDTACTPSDFDVDFTYPFLRSIDPSHPPSTIDIPDKYINAMANMERQYWEIKSRHYNVVIFFKKGKFYELYDYDAVIAHKEFGLKMVFDTTNRGKMRLAGVPEQSFSEWARLFVFRGYKVGRVEQLREDCDEGNTREAAKVKIVPRALVEVLTPGTLTDPLMLSDHNEIFLLAFCPHLMYEASMQCAYNAHPCTWIVDVLAIDLSRRVVLWCPCGNSSAVEYFIHEHHRNNSSNSHAKVINQKVAKNETIYKNINSYESNNNNNNNNNSSNIEHSACSIQSFSALLQHLRPKEAVMTFMTDKDDVKAFNTIGDTGCCANNTTWSCKRNGNTKNVNNNESSSNISSLNQFSDKAICEVLYKEALLEGVEAEMIAVDASTWSKERQNFDSICQTESNREDVCIRTVTNSFCLMAHYLRSLHLDRYVPLLLSATVYDVHLEKKFEMNDEPSSSHLLESKQEKCTNAKEPFARKHNNTLLEWEHKYDRGLILDAVTLSNLELVCNLHDGSERQTLLSFYNHCVTNGGKRLFRRWLLRPSSSHVIIRARQEVVRFFSKYVFCQARHDVHRWIDKSSNDNYSENATGTKMKKYIHEKCNCEVDDEEDDDGSVIENKMSKHESHSNHLYCCNNEESKEKLNTSDARTSSQNVCCLAKDNNTFKLSSSSSSLPLLPLLESPSSCAESLSLSSMCLSSSPSSASSRSEEQITPYKNVKRQRESSSVTECIVFSNKCDDGDNALNSKRKESQTLFTLQEWYVSFAKLNQIDLERALSRVSELKSCEVQIAYVDGMMHYKKELEAIMTAINGFKELLKWAQSLSLECATHHMTLPPLLDELLSHILCTSSSLGAIEKLYSHDEVTERAMLIPEKGECLEYDEAENQIALIERQLEEHRRNAEVNVFNGASIRYTDLGKDQFLFEVSLSDAPRCTPAGLTERARSAKSVKYTVNALTPLIASYKKYMTAKESALFNVLHAVAGRICEYFPRLHEAAIALSYIDCLLNLARMTKYNVCESCLPYICSEDAHDPLYNVPVHYTSSSTTTTSNNNNNNNLNSDSNQTSVKQHQKVLSLQHNKTVYTTVQGSENANANVNANTTAPPYHGGVLRALQIVHPLLMHNAVANNIHLGGDGEHGPILLLTGPNMAGKSTLMRTLAVNVILAQLGAPVCAKQMELKPFDRIFTRIGARDAGEKGQSTLFVELSETSQILRCASPRSLCLIDELGRGTSTHDGYAIAHATLQWLKQMRPHPPVTIFSTHYHALANDEQAKLHTSSTEQGVEHYHHNYHDQKDEFHAFTHTIQLGYMNYVIGANSAHVLQSTAHESLATVTFLYELVRGVCDRSYGVEVALMAGIPPRLVQLARHKSSQLSASTSIHQSLQCIEQFASCPEEDVESRR